MKRAQQLAWMAVVGLVVIGLILFVGGLMYGFTAYWAAMMLTFGQAVIAGLALWGLRLAAEARDIGAPYASASGMRLDGDDAAAAEGHDRVRTLDTGFQRLLTVIAAVLLLALGAGAITFVVHAYQWSNQHPDRTFPIVTSYLKAAEGVPGQIPAGLDELGLVIGIAAAMIYSVLWWLSRVDRETEGYGEAVNSCFTLGMPGMVVLAVASVLAYFQKSYASEVAAAVFGGLLVLQGLELLVNSMRTYSSIEELDQEAVDLQALPLVPMLGSVWLGGLKMLFAASVGLSAKERGERGVIARMMPRAILAIVVIAIALSCIRVVEPGTQAVLERFGYAPTDADGLLLKDAILTEGWHLTLPWPIDTLVVVPTQQLQTTEVGAELHAPKNWKNVDFQFWTYRGESAADDSENEFITGDAGAPQLLEAMVVVHWRVANTAKFYSMLSHSEFYDKSGGDTRTLPIFQAIVQDCASYAVTQSFAIHSLDQIMISDRIEVENHCRDILQKKLDALKNGAVNGSGIEIASLVIKDLHPPYWHADMPNQAEPGIGPDPGGEGRNRISRGPASAFEFVVSAREWMESQINAAQADKVQAENLAQGDAHAAISDAQTYRLTRIATAQGEAGRFTVMTENMDPGQKVFLLSLLKQQLEYAALRESLGPVTKIIVDPRVNQIQIYQPSDNPLNRQPLPPGQ